MRDGGHPEQGRQSRQPLALEYRYGLGIFALAVSVRLLLWLIYQPVAYSDTASYQRTAVAIQAGWDGLDGTRTPGYPFLLAWLRADQDGWERRAWLAQMAMGLVITLVLFWVGWQASGKAGVGGLAALAHTISPGQLFFEANLLTETLATFWLMLALAGMTLWLFIPARRSLGLAFGAGLAAALAAITRPLFVYLPAWMGVFLALRFSGSPASFRRLRLNLGPLLSVGLPSVLIIGGWALWIHEHYGNWSLSTMGGYHMIQHTGEYFEYVPDEYAAIRDTYIYYRNAQIAEHGVATNAIWEAIPAMTSASGLGFYDLSDKLSEISFQLIWEHPDLFLKNAL